ncbi:MAG TPA: hypothetical protein PLV91_07405 [Verrucomicrobiota bacterium]|nr:hypothetical protein [Verrucomicrobiota bacterium]
MDSVLIERIGAAHKFQIVGGDFGIEKGVIVRQASFDDTEEN